MTPRTTAQPQMSTEEFEELARRAPELVRLEFIHGRVQVKPVPDGNRGTIVMWLLRQCMQRRPELSLFPDQGLAIETYRKGRARLDGVLAPDQHFAGAGEWAAPSGVLGDRLHRAGEGRVPVRRHPALRCGRRAARAGRLRARHREAQGVRRLMVSIEYGDRTVGAA